MKACPNSRRRRTPGLGSFSLVEVVIAIAIVSFALVSILGLMAYSSQLVHQADNYARLSNVTRQVLARLDSQSYAFTANNLAATNYFTFDGLPTNAAAAYYKCTLANVNPTPVVLTNLIQIQVILCWPPPTYPNTNIVNTSILNYD